MPNTNENSSARAVPSTGGENSAHETLRRDGVEPVATASKTNMLGPSRARLCADNKEPKETL